MLERTKLILGDKIDLLDNKRVLVLGLGGVGGYVVESLIRSGIKDIVIVDNDTIDITNLNRQIVTTTNNIGKYKTEEWEKRIKSINNDVVVTTITKFIDMDNINLIFDLNPDYIVDACDSINVKKELIRKCLDYKVKFISSMGTGNKIDPNKLSIMDIRDSSYDPLARIIRKMVKDEKLVGKIPVVCSLEEPKKVNANGKVGCLSFVPGGAG